MKRGCAIIAVAALALLCGSALPAREDAKPGPWVKFNEMDGIVAYGRDNPRGFFKQGRLVGVIDLSVAQGENMMRDWDLYQKVFYMTLGELDQAVFEFTKAYSLNPTNPTPNLFISRVYGMLGEWEKGI
ncbi:MAG TPA: hypothetical protein PLB81_01270, partial [Deltaproteobacteria bacterium]|nr:hypothetical protein [Deltaproteobacteria bacterium]